MKYKLFIFALLIASLIGKVSAQLHYDFTAVAPSGQLLYYSTFLNGVNVINPKGTEGGAAYVSGDLIVPDTVLHTFDADSITCVLDSVSYYEWVDDFSFPDSTIVYRDTIEHFHDSIVHYIDTIRYPVIGLYYSTFRNCDSLTSVVLPSTITSIPYCCFGDCSRLKSVTIGSGVTSINSWAFSGCFALQSLYVPESVTSISNSAFNALRHIEYFGNATGAPWSAISMNGYKDGDFAYADSSKNKLIAYIGDDSVVVIPESVDTIGYGAFYVYRTLESVTIPASVSMIESSAFFGCNTLSTVNILGENAPTIGENAFAENAADRIINIPCGSLASYNEKWSVYSESLNEVGCTEGKNDTDNINDTDFIDASRIYSNNGCIVIEGALENLISVFGIDGRHITTIHKNVQERVSIPVPSKGIYIVKIDGGCSHKVLVM